MGQQIALEVEKGGGARANLLAIGGKRRRKLMDAAASRVGVTLDPVTLLTKSAKRRARESKGKNSDGNGDAGPLKKKKTSKGGPKQQQEHSTLFFLKNNIGREDYEDEETRARRLRE